jgi:hypothetical protein
MTQERKSGESAKDAYAFFDWLVKVKCPKVKEKYPQERVLATS